MRHAYVVLLSTAIIYFTLTAGCDFLGGDSGDDSTGVCEPGHMLCIADELNRCNVDGSAYVPLADCQYGCEAGNCKSNPDCQPDCTGLECGSDGCGGQCGYCAEGQSCSLGRCEVTGNECFPGDTLCSGNDLVVCVANGSMYTLLSACQYGCENAACLPQPGCTPSCSGKQCGGDGCSGSCGTCNGGYVCMAGQCVTESGTCQPDCQGKKCGPDGCGGDCGMCPSATACDMALGTCVSQGSGLISGKVTFEFRMVAVDDYGQLFLDGPHVTGAAGLVAVAWDANGVFLGATEVAEDGTYALPIGKTVEGNEQFAFLAMWVADWMNQAAPNPLVMLFPEQGGEPSTESRLMWGWGAEVPPGGDMGTQNIDEAAGSGAVFLLMFARAAMEIALFDFLQGDLSRLRPLGFIWGPNLSWSCGACYAPAPQYDEEGNLACEQSIFIGGEAGGSSAWGYPVILHEMGHYVAGNYSRDDSLGGFHAYGQPVVPPFAWSEGWASFFAVSAFSRAVGEPDPTFWDIQQGEGFWIDYEAAGTSPGLAEMTLPSLNGGMAQLMDETYVATMLWHLWDGAEFADPEPDGTALGMPGVVAAMTSARFLNWDRGAQGADLVDFLDAAMCNAPALAQNIYDTTVGFLGFPHDGQPTCMNRPERPLAVAVDVAADADGARAVVKLTAHGRVPDDVMLWVEADGAGSHGRSTTSRVLRAPETGRSSELVVDLPGDVSRVTVRATSGGTAGGAFAKATWPEAAPVQLPAIQTRPVANLVFRNLTIDRLIPLD